MKHKFIILLFLVFFNFPIHSGELAKFFDYARTNDGDNLVKIIDKVDINARNKEGRTALIIAAANRNYGVVEILLNNGANKDINDKYGKSFNSYVLTDKRLREIAERT